MECGHVLAMVSFVWSCLVLSCLPLSWPVPYRPFPSRPVPTSVVLSCLSFSRWTRVSRNKRCRPIIFVRNRFPLLLSISELGSPTTRETLHTHRNKTKPKQNFNQEFSTSQNYILEQEATVNTMDGAHHYISTCFYLIGYLQSNTLSLSIKLLPFCRIQAFILFFVLSVNVFCFDTH